MRTCLPSFNSVDLVFKPLNVVRKGYLVLPIFTEFYIVLPSFTD